MRKFSISNLLVVVFVIFLTACAPLDPKDEEAYGMIGQEVFLNVNLWYENPGKIASTNYHKGAILKVGQKFKLLDVGRKRLVFSDMNDISYSIIYYRKHTLISMPKLILRTFSKNDPTAPGGALSKFTDREQKNIRKGRIAKGMSKKAVIMAYGYPPEHRTPSLDSDTWKYWDNRWISKNVTFENDKLVSF